MTDPAQDELAFLKSMADELPVGIWVAAVPDGRLLYANRTFAEILGMTARDDQRAGGYSQPYGIHTRDGGLYPEDQLPYARAVRARATVTADDLVIHRHDGTRVFVRANARPLFDARGEMASIAIAFIDISREVLAERRLLEAQKLESIGTLAGGVAHDFNNLLAAIQVYVSTLRLSEQDASRAEMLDQVAHVVDTGANLTRSLLDLARRRPGEALRRVSLHQTVRAVLPLVERTLDARIAVRQELHAATAEVAGDPTRLEQLLLNLAINARDAMPSGGRLVLRTRDAKLSQDDAAALPPLAPGPHVVLEVEDSGPGVPPELRTRIFEPYFTTKGASPNAGTGLGLATVRMVVNAHRGAIEVASAEPHGTVMRVWLPAAPLTAPLATPAAGSARVRAGRGLVLVADDDARVRNAVQLGLRALGYEVVTAEDGDAALASFNARAARLSAVVLDLLMPGKSGREVLSTIRAAGSSVPVLLTTALPSFDPGEAASLDAAFLPKPYDIGALSEALASVIEGAGARGPAGS